MAKEYDRTLALAKELVKTLRDISEAMNRDKNREAMTDIRATMDRIQRLLSDGVDYKKS